MNKFPPLLHYLHMMNPWMGWHRWGLFVGGCREGMYVVSATTMMVTPRGGCGSNSITNTYHACSALIREFYGAINFGRCGSHVDQTDTYPYHTTKDERLSEQHLCCLYSEFAQCNTTRDEQIQF